MSEYRVLLAVAIVIAALGVAGGARILQRRRAAIQPLNLAGLPTGLILFTDAHCRRCLTASRMVAVGGVPFVEVAYNREPDRFRATGVSAVPLLVARTPDGREVGRIAGKVTPRALARLIERMGAKGQ
jgi:hypothetical protein